MSNTRKVVGAGIIRTMNRGDLERVLDWRNHVDVRRFMYTQHEISMEEHEQWYESASEDSSKHLLIFEAGGEPLGFVNFTRLRAHSIADWGFYTAVDAPRGTGKHLGRAALDYAFKELLLHKICGQALAYNERSIQFHRSLGFKDEGVLRDQHFDGMTYHNVFCFGLFPGEWWQHAD